MSQCARMIAALSLTLSLTLTLFAAAGRSDNSTGDTDTSLLEWEIIFPEDEFSQFSSCLFAGQFEQCIAYLTVNEFNVTVDLVEEGDPSDVSEEPCRYYACDTNISDNLGEFVCIHQTKSAACMTRREFQFLRQPTNGQLQSTCVLVYFSEKNDWFTFDEQASFDNCNASCSCETSITTTHGSSSLTDTTNVRPTSIESSSATTKVTAAVIAKTTATANTTAKLPSAPDTRDDMSLSNATNGISKIINESSLNANETMEKTGSNDTLVGEDNDEKTGLIVGLVVAVGGVGLIVVGILLLLCKVRWRNGIQQSTEEIPMHTFTNQRSSRDSQEHAIGASVRDSEASASLLPTTTTLHEETV